MAFTQGELDNILNASIPYFMNRGKTEKQDRQEHPMADAFERAAGEFPSGDRISVGVKGNNGQAIQGYSGDDTVTYYNPTGIKRAEYLWKEHHLGLGITETELKIDGISVMDDGDTVEHDGREMTAIANILEEKIDDLDNDWTVSWDNLIHGDGTGDPKALAGIASIIFQVPNVGTTGGISRATNAWWRNRSRTAAYATASGNAANGPIVANQALGGALLAFLQTEFRQLNRYSQGGTRVQMFAGSGFLGEMEYELRANGKYTDMGWSNGASVDAAMPEMKFKGKPIVYDPVMDDLGMTNYMYLIDMKRIRLMYMKNERKRTRKPARPYNKYVTYRALTATAALTASQLNTSGIYQVTPHAA